MNEFDKKLEKYIEHTLLRPDAAEEAIKRLVAEAIKYNFLGVCINPNRVYSVKKYLEDHPVKIVTVIGFPLGANLTEIKEFETQRAIENGADEIDMVINIGYIKDKAYLNCENDIKAVVEIADQKPVKVILETDLLTKDEIIEACKISIDAGAKFVKTSTGFVKGGVGATVENIKLMHEIVSPFKIQVKASGGIKDKKTTIDLIEAGAARIGTSSGVFILNPG